MPHIDTLDSAAMKTLPPSFTQSKIIAITDDNEPNMESMYYMQPEQPKQEQQQEPKLQHNNAAGFSDSSQIISKDSTI